MTWPSFWYGEKCVEEDEKKKMKSSLKIVDSNNSFEQFIGLTITHPHQRELVELHDGMSLSAPFHSSSRTVNVSAHDIFYLAMEGVGTVTQTSNSKNVSVIDSKNSESIFALLIVVLRDVILTWLRSFYVLAGFDNGFVCLFL
jgi:hypothetical protein